MRKHIHHGLGIHMPFKHVLHHHLRHHEHGVPIHSIHHHVMHHGHHGHHALHHGHHKHSMNKLAHSLSHVHLGKGEGIKHHKKTHSTKSHRITPLKFKL